MPVGTLLKVTKTSLMLNVIQMNLSLYSLHGQGFCKNEYQATFFETYEIYLVNSESHGKLHSFYTYHRSNSPTRFFRIKMATLCVNKTIAKFEIKKSMKCNQNNKNRSWIYTSTYYNKYENK